MSNNPLSGIFLNAKGEPFDAKGNRTVITLPIILPGDGRDKWDIIGGLISDYTKLHPEEVRDILDTVKARKRVYDEARARQGMLMVGSSMTRRSRAGAVEPAVMLPMELSILIKKHYPEVLSERSEIRMFVKKFPGFALA